MKKLILTTLVFLMTISSAFAESEMSKLQYVETKSCSNSELIRTIKETASRVILTNTTTASDQNLTLDTQELDLSDDQKKLRSAVQLTVLEEGLKITQEQKAQGITASLEGAFPKSNVAKHTKSVALAEANAKKGQVGITAPAKFDVVFNVKNASGKIMSRGRVMLDVACRVELKNKALRHTAQLIAFDVQAKNK